MPSHLKRTRAAKVIFSPSAAVERDVQLQRAKANGAPRTKASRKPVSCGEVCALWCGPRRRQDPPSIPSLPKFRAFGATTSFTTGSVGRACQCTRRTLIALGLPLTLS